MRFERLPFLNTGVARRHAHRWRRLLFALGCALVLLLLASSLWQAAASLHALGTLQAQSERTGRLDRLLIQLADAESGVRGFLLSRNRTYLEPYHSGAAGIGQTLEDIRRDIGPGGTSAGSLAELEAQVAQKLDILAASVDKGTVGEEAPRGPGADGKRSMDRIRELVAELKAAEQQDGRTSFARSLTHVQRTRWVVATLAGGALLLLLALYLLLQRQLRLRERLADLLQGENARLEALVQARTRELSDLASHLTHSREAEKARLARDLHDELGALLTAAKMDLAWLLRKLDPQALAPFRDRCERLRQALDTGIALKRRLIDDLRPPLLQEFGPVAALQALADDFAAGTGARVVLDLPAEEPRLPPDLALALYRIVQEGLTNIRKYAGARRVELALAVTPQAVELLLSDDGCGFDPGQTSCRRHGLAGMRHRVQMFCGEFVLDSRPGAGTRLRARLPLGQATGATERRVAQSL